jgi:hypothetical protein
MVLKSSAKFKVSEYITAVEMAQVITHQRIKTGFVSLGINFADQTAEPELCNLAGKLARFGLEEAHGVSETHPAADFRRDGFDKRQMIEI